MTTLGHANGQQAEVSVSVAQKIEDVESLREFWEEYGWHPRMSLDVYLAAHQAPMPDSVPYVVKISRNAKLMAIMAGRLQESMLDIRFGYLSCWKAKLRAISVPNAGLLGDFSLENA